MNTAFRTTIALVEKLLDQGTRLANGDKKVAKCIEAVLRQIQSKARGDETLLALVSRTREALKLLTP